MRSAGRKCCLARNGSEKSFNLITRYMTTGFLVFWVMQKGLLRTITRVRKVHPLLRSTSGPQEIALGCILKWQVRKLRF